MVRLTVIVLVLLHIGLCFSHRHHKKKTEDHTGKKKDITHHEPEKHASGKKKDVTKPENHLAHKNKTESENHASGKKKDVTKPENHIAHKNKTEPENHTSGKKKDITHHRSRALKKHQINDGLHATHMNVDIHEYEYVDGDDPPVPVPHVVGKVISNRYGIKYNVEIVSHD